MRYFGIDLHKRTAIIASEDEFGKKEKAKKFFCVEPDKIYRFFENHAPFRAVVEATAAYRWLYDLISPLGEVVLAHTLHLRAMFSRRAKTDKLDAALLAKLLRLDIIPEAYVPPARYHRLRDLTRSRARLAQDKVHAENRLQALCRELNVEPPGRSISTKKSLSWVASLTMSPVQKVRAGELVRRLEHYRGELAFFDGELERCAPEYPEAEALMDIHGIGLFSALLIIAELGEPERFRDGRRVAAYSGLTARVNQSGGHDYHGHITRQGSRWLRWILVQAAMKAVRKDLKLKNFYTRIRKRSSRNIARVAAARKLATICWVRLLRWRRTARLSKEMQRVRTRGVTARSRGLAGQVVV